MLGPVGVGLSVAFALFMVVLGVELYYVWRSRQIRRQAVDMSSGHPVLPLADSKLFVELSRWRAVVGGSWTAGRAEELKRWVKLHLHNVLLRRPSKGGDAGVAQTPPQPEKYTTGAVKEEEEAEEEDVDLFKVAALWGPPRHLFTITEETKEEMDLEEEVRSRPGGKGSRRASRASSELLFVASACTSPYVTPPTSPPFATPCGSPAPPNLLPILKPSTNVDSDSTTSSTSSSSPPPGHRPLSSLFEDTSSFSSSSGASSSATPVAVSPPVPAGDSCCPGSPGTKHHRPPLGLLLDPPPSPSSALYNYHNRVHPLTSSPALRRSNIDGHPILPPASRLSSLTFHLPAPCQPTTPSPFRAAAHAKSVGFLIPSNLYLTDV